MRHHGLGPIMRWVDDHLFFCVRCKFFKDLNTRHTAIAKQIAKLGGTHTKGGRTCFTGWTLPDGITEEFDEDMSLPFKDLSVNSLRHSGDTEFCYNMDNIDQISSSLGIPWEASKDIPFSDTLTFLGFVWNLSD